MSFTQITLTGGNGYRYATGAIPGRVVVRARPLVEMTNGTKVVKKEVVVPFASNGDATKTLAATTDPATTPTGNAYRFNVEVDGQVVRTFLAELPHDEGATVDIDDLVEVEAPPDLSPGASLYQPADADLTALAALGDGNPHRSGGTWSMRSDAALASALGVSAGGGGSANYVNLADYGTPDGTTNNAALVVAALADTDPDGETGPPALYVPRMAASWVIGTSVTVPNGITIFGDGWGPQGSGYSTIKLADGFSGFAFVTDTAGADGNRIVVRDLQIDGNASTQTAGGIFRVYNPIQCEFTSVHFHHAYDVALHFWGQQGSGPFGHHCRVVNSLFDNSGVSAGNGQAIRIQSCDEVTITGCDFENNGGAGSEAYHIKDWAGLNNIENNVFVGGKEGIRLQDVSGTRVIGNMFDGLNGDNIHASGSSHTIQGNYFSGVGATITPNAHQAIELDNGSHTVVDGNTFWTGSTAQGWRSVISNQTSSTHNTFTGNTIREEAAVGDGGIIDFNGGSPAAQSLKFAANTGLDDYPGAGLAVVNAKTADYTLALADAGKLDEVSSSSPVAVTVPTNASAAFPIGTYKEISREGAGLVAVVAASGVTLDAPAGLVARARYSPIYLRKRATNTWRVTGDMADRNVDPDWTCGIVSNADMTAQLPRAADLGAPVVRLEFAYTDSVATLKPVIDLCVSLGMRPQLLAAWDSGISVPDLSNLVTWATAFGPGGSNWPGGSSPYALLNIELGNENSMSYKSGSYDTGGYQTIAESYGTRARALQVAIAAAGSPVKTLIELEDGGSGSANWVNFVVSTGTSALLDDMGGPVIHAYGPDWETKIDRCAGFLATAGSTAAWYVTETGIATDNGSSMVPDNYGYDVDLTYDEAGVALAGVVNDMRESGKVRTAMLYQVSDQQSSGATTSKEHYFGAVQQSGAAKGGLTSAYRTLLASSHVDAFSL